MTRDEMGEARAKEGKAMVMAGVLWNRIFGVVVSRMEH